MASITVYTLGRLCRFFIWEEGVWVLWDIVVGCFIWFWVWINLWLRFEPFLDMILLRLFSLAESTATIASLMLEETDLERTCDSLLVAVFLRRYWLLLQIEFINLIFELVYLFDLLLVLLKLLECIGSPFDLQSVLADASSLLQHLHFSADKVLLTALYWLNLKCIVDF